MRRLVELSLELPAGWFEIPVTHGADAELAGWATSTAHDAWQLRAAAGVSEEAVFPDAGRNVAVELASLALNLRAQLAGVEQGHAVAHAWVPLPEMGFVSAVVVAQLAERSEERSPHRYVATLEALADAAGSGSGDVHRDASRATWVGTPARPALDGRALRPDAGVMTLERTCFGIFRAHTEMIEVLFIAPPPRSRTCRPRPTRCSRVCGSASWTPHEQVVTPGHDASCSPGRGQRPSSAPRPRDLRAAGLRQQVGRDDRLAAAARRRPIDLRARGQGAGLGRPRSRWRPRSPQSRSPPRSWAATSSGRVEVESTRSPCIRRAFPGSELRELPAKCGAHPGLGCAARQGGEQSVEVSIASRPDSDRLLALVPDPDFGSADDRQHSTRSRARSSSCDAGSVPTWVLLPRTRRRGLMALVA